MASFVTGLSNFIIENDGFGFPVNLNFNRSGPTANTMVGGCFSILLNSFLLFFFVLKIYGLTIH